MPEDIAALTSLELFSLEVILDGGSRGLGASAMFFSLNEASLLFSAIMSVKLIAE